MSYDVLVVGAGFAGSVVAERLASAGRRVLVVEERDHIGGNAYDETDEHGVLVHRYGPHIFHTNGKRIVEYLSRFTEWRAYEHRVKAEVDGRLYPIPINRTTINALYSLDLDEAGCALFLEKLREVRSPIVTSEDVVLSRVGRDLCDKFFRGYTRKQWGRDLSELSANVAARIPTRTNDDDRYFTDEFQQMPAAGYTALFRRLLDHPLIEVRLSTSYETVANEASCHVVYTGPVDRFFGYCLGRLPYRSLVFRFEHHPVNQYQEVGTVNYPSERCEFTRITEFKHLTGQRASGTTIVFEHPSASGAPYYPIPTAESAALFKRYEALADARRGVTFVGRLAQYRYYNMDQVVGAALSTAASMIERGSPAVMKHGSFVALILTHGRPNSVYTYDTLRRAGYTGRIVLVIDDEDRQRKKYLERYGESDVYTFSKSEIAKRIDEADNFKDRRATVYARNASFEIARELGFKYFAQLDDDYTDLRHKRNSSGEYIPRRPIKDMDAVFDALLDYFDSTPILSVAMAQGGDFIGGRSGDWNTPKRKSMNSWICSVERPFTFHGRMNDDVSTYLLHGSRGALFLTVPYIGLEQKATQAVAGGMTDIYQASGTYVKTFYSVMHLPSAVVVSALTTVYSRAHHRVSWQHAVPCILRPEHRKGSP